MSDVEEGDLRHAHEKALMRDICAAMRDYREAAAGESEDVDLLQAIAARFHAEAVALATQV